MKKFLKAVGTGQLGTLFDDDDDDGADSDSSENRTPRLGARARNGTRGSPPAGGLQTSPYSRNGTRALSPSQRNGVPVLRTPAGSSPKAGAASYKSNPAPSSRSATPELRGALSPARTPTLDRAALFPSRAVTPDQRSLGSSRCPTPEGRSPLASPRSLTPELRPPPSGSSRCGTPDHRLVPLLLSAGEDGAYAVSLLLAVMGMRRKYSLASVLHSIDGHAPSVYFYQSLSLSTGQDKLESRRQISEISNIFVLYR